MDTEGMKCLADMLMTNPAIKVLVSCTEYFFFHNDETGFLAGKSSERFKIIKIYLFMHLCVSLSLSSSVKQD